MNRKKKLEMKRETLRSLDLSNVSGGGPGDDTIGGSRRPISCADSHCFSCGVACNSDVPHLCKD
jgi:hypothetical protein